MKASLPSYSMKSSGSGGRFFPGKMFLALFSKRLAEFSGKFRHAISGRGN